ncbi:MAG TPA: adenylate/guanylate cyclase domain-containing protein [Candidatus Limnocylindria bacterium]|nr:adenylate/guanylate cyclase domain-containing protein [Candidatus Limnocylindria bacterium]
MTNSNGSNARDAEPRDVLAALGEVIRAVSSSGFDLDEVLHTIIRHAVELSRSDFGNVLRPEPEADYFRAIVYYGDVEPAYWDLVTKNKYVPDEGSMIGRTLLARAPVQIEDVLQDKAYTALDVQRAGGYRTILGVPLLRADEMIGLFIVWRNVVDPYTADEISLLTTFADQAVLAIDNLRLFQTIRTQQTELARFAPQAAELLSTDAGAELLAGHRREITAMFADLRGFTTFAESAEPEEVLGVLREYHAAVGEIVASAGGTVEHFAGDGLMAFFNDPRKLDDHQRIAVRSAIQIRDRFLELAAGWSKRGYDLGVGIGLAVGFATLGRIGFEGRFDYGAVGNVVILASRLSDAAAPGEILLSQRLNAAVEGSVPTEALPEKSLKGFTKPVQVFRVGG